MKHCDLKNKLCKYVKKEKDSPQMKGRAICILQAMLDASQNFDINKMRECPLECDGILWNSGLTRNKEKR